LLQSHFALPSSNLLIYFRTNPKVAEEIVIYDTKSLNESQFSSKRPTKLILHGFTDVDAPGEWINVIKEAYLGALDVNVLVADFSSFSLPLLFRTNLPIFASKRLAEMIMFLEKNGGASGDMVHIIARSYGCHIAGMTGRLLGGSIGRITALEPAEKIAIDGAPEYKVTKEDAQFVDVRKITMLNSQLFTKPLGTKTILRSRLNHFFLLR
jgi:hypothetical protein